MKPMPALGPLRTMREGCGVGGLFYRQGAKSAKDAKEIQKASVSSLRPWRSLRLGGKKDLQRRNPHAPSAVGRERATIALPEWM